MSKSSKSKTSNPGRSRKTLTTKEARERVASAVALGHGGKIPPNSQASRMDAAWQRAEATKRGSATPKSEH